MFFKHNDFCFWQEKLNSDESTAEPHPVSVTHVFRGGIWADVALIDYHTDQHPLYPSLGRNQFVVAFVVPENEVLSYQVAMRFDIKTEPFYSFTYAGKNYTGLFEMIVGVLTTCHTQHTWDSSM
jgi:hypothetical protein